MKNLLAKYHIIFLAIHSGAFFELTDQNRARRMGFICVPGTRTLPNLLFLANGTGGVRVVYVWEGGVGVKI